MNRPDPHPDEGETLPRAADLAREMAKTTALAILGSNLLTWLLAVEWGGMAPSKGLYATATLVPLLVAPILSWRTISLMTSLREAHARMRQMAGIDHLTGLLNRQRFIETYGRQLERALHGGAPQALMMLDLDHFKGVNDTHGHPVGDQVLVAVAAQLQAALRPDDAVARWGGEEFVVGLGAGGAAQALATAERVRAAIEAIHLPTATGAVVRPTISIGVAWSRPSPSETLDALVQRADEALYAAKKAGRNRVESSA